MAAPTITTLPPAPVRGEDRETFASKANDHVASLSTFVTETNAVGTYVENTANDIGDAAATIQDGGYVYAADTGTANAYVMTLSPAPTVYTAGAQYRFKATNANTGASTLNINSLGVKSIVRSGGGALSGGDIKAGAMIVVIYDGTNFIMIGNGTAAYADTTTSATDTTPGRVWRTDDLVKTTGPTDSTSGRMLKNADHGFGVVLAYTTFDLNSASYGWLGYNASATNSPGGSGLVFTGKVITGTDVREFQHAIASGDSYFAYRTKASGVWGAWKKIWTDSNFDPTTKADLASPTFTGTPAAPTAAASASTTQLATTAFVQQEMSSKSVGAVGTYGLFYNNGSVTLNEGDTTAGSNLKYSSAGGSARSANSPSGTWRCMGYAIAAGTDTDLRVSLFLRIS